jgi:transcriptional regulator with XRE-family HTH domain
MALKIGKTLRQLVKDKDLTLKELSKRTGVSASTLSEWNNNRRPKDPVQIQKVANELGVTIHYLLFGEEDKQDALQKIMKEDFFTGTFEVSIKKVKVRND